MTQLWVFDGDDTLWFVESLYDDARKRAATVVACAGLDSQLWEARERVADVINVKRLGVTPERFPTSCVQAYEEQAQEVGLPVRPEVAAAVWRAAETVFDAPAPTHPDARTVVATLRAHGPVVLLTKGDQHVQEKRIADAGLRDAFDEIEIVAQKDEDAFRAVLDRHGFPPERAWSIGNSLPSDINPALRLGMNAVWIDAHVWEFERSEAEPSNQHVRITHDLRDVPFVTLGVPLAVG